MGTPRSPADAPEDSDWLTDVTAEHGGREYIFILDGDPGPPEDDDEGE